MSWVCDYCGNNNFDSDEFCLVCDTPKPLKEEAVSLPKWTCLYCHTENNDEEAVCTNCGKRKGAVPRRWTCRCCGEKNEGTVSVCENCGAAKNKVMDKWECPVCGESNFALVEVCASCGRAKGKAAQKWKCLWCGEENSAVVSRCKKCDKDKSEEPPMWTCLCCGANNGGSLTECAECGKPKGSTPPRWTCLCCGTSNSGTASKCSKCGKRKGETPPKWTCPSCGKKNSWTAYKCVDCGAEKGSAPSGSASKAKLKRSVGLVKNSGHSAMVLGTYLLLIAGFLLINLSEGANHFNWGFSQWVIFGIVTALVGGYEVMLFNLKNKKVTNALFPLSGIILAAGVIATALAPDMDTLMGTTSLLIGISSGTVARWLEKDFTLGMKKERRAVAIYTAVVAFLNVFYAVFMHWFSAVGTQVWLGIWGILWGIMLSLSVKLAISSESSDKKRVNAFAFRYLLFIVVVAFTFAFAHFGDDALLVTDIMISATVLGAIISFFAGIKNKGKVSAYAKVTDLLLAVSLSGFLFLINYYEITGDALPIACGLLVSIAMLHVVVTTEDVVRDMTTKSHNVVLMIAELIFAAASFLNYALYAEYGFSHSLTSAFLSVALVILCIRTAVYGSKKKIRSLSVRSTILLLTSALFAFLTNISASLWTGVDGLLLGAVVSIALIALMPTVEKFISAALGIRENLLSVILLYVLLFVDAILCFASGKLLFVYLAITVTGVFISGSMIKKCSKAKKGGAIAFSIILTLLYIALTVGEILRIFA